MDVLLLSAAVQMLDPDEIMRGLKYKVLGSPTLPTLSVKPMRRSFLDPIPLDPNSAAHGGPTLL